MKKIVSLMLSAMLLVILPACQKSAAPSAPPERQPAALEVANAILSDSGYNGQSGELEYLTAEEDETGFLTAYLENAYGLSEGAWRDAAVIRVTGASAFELAVLRLDNQDEAAWTVALLTEYISGRQGDFAGYAPEQADMVANGELAQNGAYVALCICPDPDRAAAAFFAAVNGSIQIETGQPDIPPSVTLQPDRVDRSESETPETPGMPKPEETSKPQEPRETSKPQETEYVASYPGRCDFVQPNNDDMSIYDTSAILAAWISGDSSQLSGYDQDIYNAAQKVLGSVLESGMSDLEKETAVYSWIVNSVNYDWTHQDVMRETPRESFTPYGGLVNRTAVCLGYATTFQLLMDLAGVECITVAGAAYASQEDHGWNMVRLNGNWYCVDVTWDANYREYGATRGREREWMFFNIISDNMAATDHQWDYANIPEAVTVGHGRS